MTRAWLVAAWGNASGITITNACQDYYKIGG
jgi:hypothetical protein